MLTMRLLSLSIAFFLPLCAWANDDLTQARRLFDQMKFAEAQAKVEQVLISPVDEPGLLVRAFALQGLCLAAQGQTDQAVSAFRKLLSIQPDHRLSSDLSPKLTSLFYQTVARTADQPAISLAHQPPEPGEQLGGMALQVTVVADPQRLVDRIRLRLLTGDADSPDEVIITVNGPGPVEVAVPAGMDKPEVAYYFEALNRHGGVLVRSGSRTAPFVLRAQKPAAIVSDTGIGKTEETDQPRVIQPPDENTPVAEPWYATWWFWTGVGVVVVGSIATTAVLMTDSNGGTPDIIDYRVEYGIR